MLTLQLQSDISFSDITEKQKYISSKHSCILPSLGLVVEEFNCLKIFCSNVDTVAGRVSSLLHVIIHHYFIGLSSPLTLQFLNLQFIVSSVSRNARCWTYWLINQRAAQIRNQQFETSWHILHNHNVIDYSCILTSLEIEKCNPPSSLARIASGASVNLIIGSCAPVKLFSWQ